MPVPSSFDAAVMKEAGARSVVESRSLAPLASHEVGIKITATAINPVDWKIRDYKLLFQKFPAVGGSDAAGEIVQVGDEVKDFQIGDRVFFQGILGEYDASTFQQYAKIDHKLVAKTPDNITDEQAAGISLATMAALTGFYEASGWDFQPYPWEDNGSQAGNGKSIVIIGGSSSVGQYAIQLARLSGFSKIVTNSSPTHFDMVKKLGATHVIDRSISGVEEYVKALGDDVLPYIFDTISIPSTEELTVQIAKAIKNKGDSPTIVSRVNPQPPSPEAQKLADQEPKVIMKGIYGSGNRYRHISEPSTKWLGGKDGLIAKGLFVPNEPVLVEGGLAALDEAFDKNKKGVSGVKVVIRPFGP